MYVQINLNFYRNSIENKKKLKKKAMENFKQKTIYILKKSKKEQKSFKNNIKEIKRK